MLIDKRTLPYVGLMTLVVVSSNYLVQFPFNASLFGINLADLLTYGAFTYPFAFLVTDLTNRQFGTSAARRVVAVGFAIAVLFSIFASTHRIAIASGTAYLVGQLLDITVFNRLRRLSWWKAPLVASLLGSAIDTVIFFSLAFAPIFAFIGPNDDFATGWSSILGVFSTEAPRWISWLIGDFVVKLLCGVVLLLPYGAFISVVKPMPTAAKA
ncbi:MAG TPA: queuosine precursor transporter [Ensifer sp.]|nr:queuosine precursor transporter [Ensifer sp.]